MLLWFTNMMLIMGTRTVCFMMLAALLMLPSCGSGGASETGTVVPSDVVVGEAVIGPDGGVLQVLTGDDAGVFLEVPSGAVAFNTRFRVLRVVQHEQVPSPFPVYRVEPSALDFSGEPVTLTMPASGELFQAGAPSLTMFARNGSGSPWRAITDTAVDVVARTITADVTRLGEFLAWEGSLHRLFTQELRLYDPAIPVASASLFGSQAAVENGAVLNTVGSGSLASFWNSSSSDNVLILHGVFGSPLDFLGEEDLIANLKLTKSNVVLLSYPSARGIAYLANELYNLIEANRKPGFGCSIVGHSIGGLIARYMLERSATDPARNGFNDGDNSMDQFVDKLVMLGVPNAGASQITFAFERLQSSLTGPDLSLVQISQDLNELPSSLPILMNANYVDNATLYHLIYGDLGTGTDGVVTTASALALPLTSPATATLFNSGHDDLHLRATSTGVAIWLGTLLQGQ